MNHNLLYGLLAVVVVLSAVNLFFVTSAGQSASAAVVKAQEDSRPAEIEVVKISDPSCSDCFNIDKVLSELKTKNVKVLKEEALSFSSDAGKELIKKFGIIKLPTLIVSGEVKKPGIESYFKAWGPKEDAGKNYAVFKDVLPPYVNPVDGQVIGRVSATTIMDSECPDCTDVGSLVTALEQQAGVVFSTKKTVGYRSAEAQDLIKRFGVERIPAIIISKNILEYPAVKEVWSQLNATEKNGFFALHAQQPPYRDARSGQIKGLVTMVYLTDNSCKNCYDVKNNRQIAGRLGLALEKVDEFDVNSSEGKELIAKYKIEKAPIALFSPDAKEYPLFVQVWPEVGSVETDGWFVMRKPDLLGNYRDLTTGNEIIIQKQQTEGGRG